MIKTSSNALVSDQGSRVVAVITAYNPDVTRFFFNFRSLEHSEIKTIVVNDGSTFEEYEFRNFRQAVRDLGFDLINLSSNRGIAYALNTGIKRAFDEGADFVLLLDQDSSINEELVKGLLNAHESLLLKGHKIAAVGPRHVDVKTGMKGDFFILEPCQKAEPQCIAPEYYVKCDFLITSGCLISRQAFDAIGYMDETLFIDGVDFEWFFRAKSLGYHAYGVNDVVLHHNLGETARRIWFFRWRNIPSHAPFRYYYMFRNSILLSRRPYVPKAWIRFELKRLIKIALISCVFVSPRITNARMILKGIRDGLMGKSGKIPQ